jgi:hypothetical protein
MDCQPGQHTEEPLVRLYNRAVPIWARLTVLVAGIRSTSSLALFLSTESGSTVHLGVPLSTYFVLTTSFTLPGLGLIAGTERDDRASWLGGLLTLIGAPLATPLLLAMAVREKADDHGARRQCRAPGGDDRHP